MRESASFSAFTQGIRDMNMKMKLNEAAHIRTFEAAISFGKHLERVSTSIMGGDSDVTPILYQTRANFPIRKETIFQDSVSYFNSANETLRDSSPILVARY